MSTVPLVSLGSNQKKKALCRVCVADKGIFELRDEKNDVDTPLVRRVNLHKGGRRGRGSARSVRTSARGVVYFLSAEMHMDAKTPVSRARACHCVGRAVRLPASMNT